MLFLLSPAKTLDFERSLPSVEATEPVFKKYSSELISVLKTKTHKEISELMSLSDNLSALNLERYKNWSPKFTAKNSRPALLAFNGDVYEGLDAYSLSQKNLKWAQDHLAILSGLYGVLRPLDKMQPYRLEMGTNLQNERGNNLYKFWDNTITEYLNTRLAHEKNPTIINLASQEYFKSVQLKTLNAKVIECVFEQEKSGQFKVISFLAKRARGLMARFAIEQQIKSPETLQKFNSEGYSFQENLSTPDRLLFRKKSN